MAKKSTARQQNIAPVFLIVLIIIGVIVAWQLRDSIVPPAPTDQDVSVTPPPTSDETPQDGSLSPTASPTPIAILQGRETYTIGQGSGTTGPKITRAIVEPHDPKQGQQQTVTVSVNHSSPITSVSLVMKSDNDTKTYPLSLASGSETNGQWSGTWTVEDTVLYTYAFTISVESPGGSSSVDLIIR